MFAVVKTGGKQYKVAQGDVIQVEKLPGEANATVELKEVLLIVDNGSIKAGTPFVAGAKVAAEIVAQDRTGKYKSWHIRKLAVHPATDATVRAAA